MKTLTEKQLNNKLNKYYLKHYGENETDEFYVNPAINKWKFVRDGKIIIIVCDSFRKQIINKHLLEETLL
jgi:hypothetical protein